MRVIIWFQRQSSRPVVWFQRQGSRRQFLVLWVLFTAWVAVVMVGTSAGIALSGQGFVMPSPWRFLAAGLFFAIAIPIYRKINRDQRAGASDADDQD